MTTLIYIFIAEEALKSRDKRIEELDAKERRIREMEEEMKKHAEKAATVVRLSIRGKTFATYRENLLRFEKSYFHGMLSSGHFKPQEDGTYFIDIPFEGFERVLHYLCSGKLSTKGLSEYELTCVKQNLDYLQLPVPDTLK